MGVAVAVVGVAILLLSIYTAYTFLQVVAVTAVFALALSVPVVIISLIVSYFSNRKKRAKKTVAKESEDGSKNQEAQTVHSGEESEEKETIRLRPRWFILGMFVWIAVVVGSPIATYFYANYQVPGTILNFWHFVMSLCIVWVAFSTRKVPTDEIAAVECYGLPMVVMTRGLKFVPYGIFQMKTFPSTVLQHQFPDEPEFIQKTDDKDKLQPVLVTREDGSTYQRMMVRPIRITSSATRKKGNGETEKKELGILDTQMTVEFTFWVRWVIVNPFYFLINAGGNVENAVKQMRDTGETTLTTEVVIRTPAQINDDFEIVKQSLKDKISAELKSWGIQIIDVGLTPPDFNHKVAKQLRNITTAKAKAEQVVITAEATMVEKKKHGMGDADARKRIVAADGKGYKEAAEALGISPELYLQAIVAQNSIGEGDVILGTEGITQMMGLGRKIMEQRPATNTEEV